MEKPFVLVVDDNPAVRTLLAAILQRDFAVETAIDGAEAIEMLRTKTYGAIILDLVMPEFDGYAVLEFLKEHDPATLQRVIVVTAAILGGHMQRLPEFNICTVIRKPFDVDAVISAVRQCVDETSSRGGLVSSGVVFLLAEFLSRRLM
jgi:putative two-component system response regulator